MEVIKPFKKIYLQFKNYDGTEATETEITWSPVRINKDDVEYTLFEKLCCDCKKPLPKDFIYRCPDCWERYYFP